MARFIADVSLKFCHYQAYTSVQRSPLQLTDHKELAHLMNTISFHTKMVDFLDEMLNETSDMSFFCFYYKQVGKISCTLVNE